MSAFFELRTYKVLTGKMKEWVEFMEKTILPFQISKGMVVHGSFTVDQEENTYVWIRRFSSKEQKDKLYQDVYESEEWKNNIQPRAAELLDMSAMVVRKLKATELSVMK